MYKDDIDDHDDDDTRPSRQFCFTEWCKHHTAGNRPLPSVAYKN
jgi:hypothetical protein